MTAPRLWHLLPIAFYVAISVGTGASVLYEFSGDAPASEFVLGGLWYCGATMALVAPMLQLARRSASAWLLYRAGSPRWAGQ